MTDSEVEMDRNTYVINLTLEQVIRAEKRRLGSLPTLAHFRSLHDSVIGTPGPAVLELANILARAQRKIVIVEVNFDRLVETHSFVPLQVFSSDEEFERASEYVEAYIAGRETSVPLLKLHGSIERPETCVVSEEQTEAGVGNGKLRAIRALYADPPRLWVYVGTSMRDRDLLHVFKGSDYTRGTEEVWVSPYLVSTVEEFAWSKWAIWKNRDLHTIDERFVSETADTFLSVLNAAWPNE